MPKRKKRKASKSPRLLSFILNLLSFAKQKILAFDLWFVALSDKVGDSIKEKIKRKRPGKKKRATTQKNFFTNLNNLPKIRLNTILGIAFIVLGFVSLYISPNIAVPEFKSKKEPIVASREFKKDEKALSVVRILLPKEDIDLKVTPAKLVNGYWQTTESGASQGEGTANPGTGGNVVVFAHARQGLFYNLKDVKKDEIIYVFTKDRWFRYKVSEVRQVFPKDIATVAPTKHEVLTLFTCSGFFDEKRLIVKALPMKSF